MRLLFEVNRVFLQAGGAELFAGACRYGTGMADQADIEASGRTAVASYVATLSADLAAMSRRTGLDTLGYLLEMVRLEAESATRQSNGPDGRR